MMISVIVPVYNAENSLRRCIDSVLSQRTGDFELLLIDDGSTDMSGSICDEYATEDCRVHVFHKSNGGVSSARNLGLHYAKGDWVCFVDSDDCLTAEAFSYDLSGIDDNLILFTSSFKSCDEISHSQSANKNEIVIDFQRLFTEYEFSMRVIWGKLYKRSSIGELRFNENLKLGEDTLFNLSYLYRIQSVRIESRPFYTYFHYGEDIFWRKYKLKISEAINSLSLTISAYQKLNLKNMHFEKDMFYIFKGACQTEIDRNPSLWFKNPIVKCRYLAIKKYLTWNQRFRYELLSHSFISRINVWIKCK